MTDMSVTTFGVEDGMTKKARDLQQQAYLFSNGKGKFYFNDCYKYAHFDDIDGIITDKAPDPAAIGTLESAGVQLY